MSMQDPIGDMLTCIRNSQLVKKIFLYVYYSKFKESIIKIIFQEGFIKSYKTIINNGKKRILINLKYFSGVPVISKIIRVSTPGLRVYKCFNKIPKFMSGFGLVILTTSKGVMSDKEARFKKLGGEIICYIS